MAKSATVPFSGGGTSAKDSATLATATGEPRLTLIQKLALSDPERCGGEAMATGHVGDEAPLMADRKP